MSAPIKRGTAQNACTEAKWCNATEWCNWSNLGENKQQIMLVQTCTNVSHRENIYSTSAFRLAFGRQQMHCRWGNMKPVCCIAETRQNTKAFWGKSSHSAHSKPTLFLCVDIFLKFAKWQYAAKLFAGTQLIFPYRSRPEWHQGPV